MIKYKRHKIFPSVNETKQCEYFHEWLCIKNIWHHHSPNGELRNKIIGAKLKRMGTSAGFPDYIIPYAKKSYYGLYIEVKSANGKLSPTQKEWFKFLNEQNYLAVSCKGWLEATKIVEDYFS
jgi:hypothetical protein